MRYSIARKIQTQEAIKINKLTELSQDEYNFLFAEETEIRNLLTIKELFRITQINNRTILQFFKNYDNRIRSSRMLIDPLLHINRIQINSDLMNYLFSFRTYLDHCLTLYSRQYGHESTEKNNFQSLCSDLFDANFEYRFFYKLRNFTQHCGLPIEIFNIEPSIIDGRYNLNVQCKFDPNYLLEKFEDWGKIVKPELVQMVQSRETIDVLSTVERFQTNLEVLDDYFNSICEKHIEPIKSKLLTMIEPETSLENLCITYFNSNGQTLIVDSVIKYIEHIETVYR